MLRDSLRIQFLKSVEEAGMADHAQPLLDVARECVHFFYGEPTQDLPTASSKVGGLPDLPASIDWPDGLDAEGNCHGKAEFLAQFDLAQVPQVDGLDLPRSGHLWIFVNNTKLIYSTATIFYRDIGEPLLPRENPQPAEPDEGGWTSEGSTALSFEPAVSLPFSSKNFASRFPDRALHDLSDLLLPGADNYGRQKGIGGQLGGYSYQAEVDLCRQLAFNDLKRTDCCSADYWASVEEFEAQFAESGSLSMKESESDRAYKERLRAKAPQVKWIAENDSQIQAAADSWQLLCMFRPNMDINLKFGSGMYLDFIMRDSALAQRDFSKVHCILPMLL